MNLILSAMLLASSSNWVERQELNYDLQVAEYNEIVGGLGFGANSKYLLAWERTEEEELAVVDWVRCYLNKDVIRMRYMIICLQGRMVRVNYHTFWFSESTQDRQVLHRSENGSYNKFWPLKYWVQ